MADAKSSESAKPAADSGRMDLWTAVVLTSAGLLSAWASFQSNMWGGLEAEHFHRANAELTRSSELAIAAGQREAAHVGLFISWLAANAEGQDMRALYLERQLEQPFAREFARWRAQLPDNLRQADGRVGRPAFAGLLGGPSKAARLESDAAMREANRSGGIADRYDRWTVLLATALFLAGMAGVLKARPAKRLMIGFAAVLTLAAMVALLLLPVSFGG